MFSKTKRAAILVAASALLATSLGGNIAYADVTNGTDSVATSTSTSTSSSSNVSTATNDNNDTSNQVVSSTNAQTNGTSSYNNSLATTQAAYKNINATAVKSAMLAELNRLRTQNGLA